jgi:pimeloyl-ACP methyl ester carboxylesterase
MDRTARRAWFLSEINRNRYEEPGIQASKTGYNCDTFAEDLHKLVTQLELRDFTLVGFSMGCGEVARYLGKYGSKGVSKAVIISGVPPFLLKTSDNPEPVGGKGWATLHNLDTRRAGERGTAGVSWEREGSAQAA